MTDTQLIIALLIISIILLIVMEWRK